MIEKSVYEDYEIEFSDTYTSNDAYYFAFNENRELYLKNKKLITEVNELDINFSLFIGKYKRTYRQKACCKPFQTRIHADIRSRVLSFASFSLGPKQDKESEGHKRNHRRYHPIEGLFEVYGYLAFKAFWHHDIYQIQVPVTYR